MLDATLYSFDEEGDLKSHHVEDIDYVYIINDTTWGPPALVAPSKDSRTPVCRPGQTVLYINSRLVPAFDVTREEE